MSCFWADVKGASQVCGAPPPAEQFHFAVGRESTAPYVSLYTYEEGLAEQAAAINVPSLSVRSISSSIDGSLLGVGYYSNGYAVFNTSDQSVVKSGTESSSGVHNDVSISPDNEFAAFVCNHATNKLRIHNLNSGAINIPASQPPGFAICCVYSDDGLYLAVGCGNYPSTTIVIYETESFSVVYSGIHGADLRSACFSGGRFIFGSYDNGTVYAVTPGSWSVASYEVFTGGSTSIRCMAASSDRTRVVVGGFESPVSFTAKVKVIDAVSFAEIGEAATDDFGGVPYGVAFTPNGNVIFGTGYSPFISFVDESDWTVSPITGGPNYAVVALDSYFAP